MQNLVLIDVVDTFKYVQVSPTKAREKYSHYEPYSSTVKERPKAIADYLAQILEISENEDKDCNDR